MLACLAVLLLPSTIAHEQPSSSSANVASEQDILTHQATIFSTISEQTMCAPDGLYNASGSEIIDDHAESVTDAQFRGPWIPSGYETKDAQILDALEIFYWQHYVSTSDLLVALGELEGFLDRSHTENITLIFEAITYALSLIDFPLSAVRKKGMFMRNHCTHI